MNIPLWMKKKSFIIPVAVVIVIAVVANSGGAPDTGTVQGDQDTAVHTITVAPQDSIESTIELSGVLLPQEYTQLKSRVSAQVQSMVPVGTRVRAGQVVATLYDSSISQTHAQALVAVNAAQQNLSETLSLNTESVTQAELAVNAAQASLVAAQSNFENTQSLNDQNFSATLDAAEVAYESAYNTIEQVIRYWGDGGSLNEFTLRDMPTGNASLLNDTTNDFERLKGAYLGLSPNVVGDIGLSLVSVEAALATTRDFNDNVFRTLSYAVAIPSLGYPQTLIDSYSAQATAFTNQINAQNTSVKSAKSSVGTIDVTTQSAFIASKNQLDQAQIQYTNAQSALASAKRQADIRTLSAQSQLSSAQIQLTNAQFQNLSLTAPFDGVVIAQRANVGDQVNPGMDVIEMGKTDAIEIKLSLDESNSGALALGQEVVVNEVVSGDITELSPTASLTTGKIDFTVVVQNTEGLLNPGDVGRISIVRTIPINTAIVLPLAHVTIGQDETFVLVAQEREEEDGYVASKRLITLGESIDDYVVIESGLTEGDVVIKKNGTFLTEGDEVTIVVE